MKLLAFMSHDLQTTTDNLRSLKSGYEKAKRTGMNYIIHHGNTWTLTQAAAMIKLLVKQQETHDKIHRTEPTTPAQTK